MIPEFLQNATMKKKTSAKRSFDFRLANVYLYTHSDRNYFFGQPSVACGISDAEK
jgi:hypothetical protein